MNPAETEPSPGRSHGYVYDAFASYTTAADYQLVRRVEAFLETFHKLPNPGKLQLPPLQLCVDGSDFSITRFRASLRANRTGLDSSQISNEIERMVAEQLDNSARLLVFCPGLINQGYWSNWEIQWFLTNRGADDIYLVITGGHDPLRDPAAFFPSGVIAAGLHTRIFYDLREQHWWRSRTWHGVRDFDEELARLASDLSGRSLGEIQPIWFRERRKTLRRIVAAAVTVAVVTLLLAFYAWSQQRLAEQRRLVAERQTRVGTSASSRPKLVPRLTGASRNAVFCWPQKQ